MATVTQLATRAGITARGAPSEHGVIPHAATSGTDTTPSVTETYLTEIVVPNNCTLTGFSLLNGSAVAGNVTVYLTDDTGVLLARSASTAQSGTAALQAIPFASATPVVGPGVYYVLVQFDSTSARFRSQPLGVSPGGKLTSTTYGTFPSGFTVPTTFTANLAPFGSLY